MFLAFQCEQIQRSIGIFARSSMNWAKYIEMHCSGRKTRKGLLRLRLQVISGRKLPSTNSKPDGDITWFHILHQVLNLSRYTMHIEDFSGSQAVPPQTKRSQHSSCSPEVWSHDALFAKFSCTLAHLLSRCSFEDFMESWGKGRCTV